MKPYSVRLYFHLSFGFEVGSEVSISSGESSTAKGNNYQLCACNGLIPSHCFIV